MKGKMEKGEWIYDAMRLTVRCHGVLVHGDIDINVGRVLFFSLRGALGFVFIVNFT